MSDPTTTDLTRADVCAVAIAEAFRGDGERLCNPIGNLPLIGGRLALATFEPELALTDGFYTLVDPQSPDDVPPPPRRRRRPWWRPSSTRWVSGSRSWWGTPSGAPWRSRSPAVTPSG